MNKKRTSDHYPSTTPNVGLIDNSNDLHKPNPNKFMPIVPNISKPNIIYINEEKVIILKKMIKNRGVEFKDRNHQIVDKKLFKNGLCKVIIENIPKVGYIYRIVEPYLTIEEKEILNIILALFKQTIDYDVSAEKSHNELRKTLFKFIEQIISKYDVSIPEQSKEKIYYYLERDIIGYDKIDLLLKDENVEDISCNGPEYPIFIYHRLHENIPTNIIFESDNYLDSFIIRLAQRSGKHISLSQPMVDGRLQDGSRIQCTLQEVTPRGSTFTIRRFRETPLTPIDLIKKGTLSVQMAAYLWLTVENGASILFCGGTASGKTTALNAISLFIPPTKKIVSIEDTRELNIPHQNWIAGVTREGFAHGQNQSTDVDMFDLIKAALRQRPQVLVVGEVRGKETFIMFQAMATGHTAYSTIHAENLEMLMQRLENPPISLPRVLLTSLDLVMFLKQVRVEDKFTRKITQIVEIVRMDSENKQIMTEIPFYWKTNMNKFKSSGQSKVLDEYMRKMDWSSEKLELDLKRRAGILKTLANKEKYLTSDFTQMVESYYHNAPTTYVAIVGKNNLYNKVGEYY